MLRRLLGISAGGTDGTPCAGWRSLGCDDIDGGMEAGRSCRGGETEDSFEPAVLSSEAISTVTAGLPLPPIRCPSVGPPGPLIKSYVP